MMMMMLHISYLDLVRYLGTILYVIHGHRRYNFETATVLGEFQTKHHGICCYSLSFIQSHNIHLSSSPALSLSLVLRS